MTVKEKILNEFWNSLKIILNFSLGFIIGTLIGVFVVGGLIKILEFFS